MVLNLLKAKENVNVPLKCPAAKKPQQIISAQPKQNKQKVSALEHTKLLTVTVKQQLTAEHYCLVDTT